MINHFKLKEYYSMGGSPWQFQLGPEVVKTKHQSFFWQIHLKEEDKIRERIERFSQMADRLRLKEWKSIYDPKDINMGVFDGWGWIISFKEDGKTFKKSGRNAFPSKNCFEQTKVFDGGLYIELVDCICDIFGVDAPKQDMHKKVFAHLQKKQCQQDGR
ncbi:MAG: hypothetical protein ACSHYA_07585 [Opitutaceae bacterium]